VYLQAMAPALMLGSRQQVQQLLVKAVCAGCPSVVQHRKMWNPIISHQ
jgi:hypothetical protein